MTPAPKRRWFRYSLRTLLIWIVPLFAFCAAVLATDNGLTSRLVKIALIGMLWAWLLRKDNRNRQRAAESSATQI